MYSLLFKYIIKCIKHDPQKQLCPKCGCPEMKCFVDDQIFKTTVFTTKYMINMI
jgi:hypothetical protein